MIVADRKPLTEILKMIEAEKKILIVGCKGCVTVCNTGGLKEVEILAASLGIARKKENSALTIDTTIIERQCDNEYVAQLSETVNDYDAVLSMACGVGPQFLSEAYPDQKFFPPLIPPFTAGPWPMAYGKSDVPVAAPVSSTTLKAFAHCPV